MLPTKTRRAATPAGAEQGAETQTDINAQEERMNIDGLQQIDAPSRRGKRAPASGLRSGSNGTPSWYCPGMGAEPKEQGPFTADQILPGEPYELSNGWLVACPPTGGDGSEPNQLGAAVVSSDPDVKQAGVDTGYSPSPGMLRAPDVAVGNVPDTPGWVKGVPDLAIEYASFGQDEPKLAQKIRDLLDYGTKLVWVVRLNGRRRVEVHQQGKPMRVAWPGERIEAPGILRNAVLVESLYDRTEAERAMLTNLLQRQGYDDLEAVRGAGVDEGRRLGLDEGRILAMRAALGRVLSRRGLTPDMAEEARIEGCADLAVLERWHEAAITVASIAETLR